MKKKVVVLLAVLIGAVVFLVLRLPEASGSQQKTASPEQIEEVRLFLTDVDAAWRFRRGEEFGSAWLRKPSSKTELAFCERIFGPARPGSGDPEILIVGVLPGKEEAYCAETFFPGRGSIARVYVKRTPDGLKIEKIEE